MPERFPGLASRIRERIKALGYWKYDKLNVADFCAELKYDPRSVYPWIKVENPRYPAESLDRLVEDLKTTKAYLVHGIGPAVSDDATGEPDAATAEPAPDKDQKTQAQQIAELTRQVAELRAERTKPPPLKERRGGIRKARRTGGTAGRKTRASGQ